MREEAARNRPFSSRRAASRTGSTPVRRAAARQQQQQRQRDGSAMHVWETAASRPLWFLQPNSGHPSAFQREPLRRMEDIMLQMLRSLGWPVLTRPKASSKPPPLQTFDSVHNRRQATIHSTCEKKKRFPLLECRPTLGRRPLRRCSTWRYTPGTPGSCGEGGAPTIPPVTPQAPQWLFNPATSFAAI